MIIVRHNLKLKLRFLINVCYFPMKVNGASHSEVYCNLMRFNSAGHSEKESYLVKKNFTSHKEKLIFAFISNFLPIFSKKI